MGDRVSIAFRNLDEESIALFDHWGGENLPLGTVREYCEQLSKDMKKGVDDRISTPLSRMEPNTMMVDFCRWFFPQYSDKHDEMCSRHQFKHDVPGHITSTLYFGKDGTDGDNSDNGHWVVNCTSGNMVMIGKEGEAWTVKGW
jgi:hypothetical protein